jgi:nitroimidazol reductase NimA-like FMN-containing flavoprotein (pyridoxamine 5'-phosphate oxidase superfamily)
MPITLQSLDDVMTQSRRFGPTAFLATTRPDGRPHAVPVAVNWVDGLLTAFVATASVKVANLRVRPYAMVHFAVSEANGWDSLMLEGPAHLVDTVEGRRALWGRMGYDLAAFEPGGPEADTHVFIQVEPAQATVLEMYGIKGRSNWKAS